MLLLEDLIIWILLLHIEHPQGNGDAYPIAALHQVCVMLRRICDSPEVLRGLPLRDLRQGMSWPGVRWLRFEERLRLASNREVVCIAGMEKLMTWWDPASGLALVNQAVIAGDSDVAYFLAML